MYGRFRRLRFCLLRYRESSEVDGHGPQTVREAQQVENFNHAVSLSHLILEDNTKEARNKVRNELDRIVKADPFMCPVATRSTLQCVLDEG